MRGGTQRSFCEAMEQERGNDHHRDAALAGMLVYENNLQNIMALAQH